jgi:uncharacterized protein involved in type VI secretion and phage assembly
VLSSAPPAISLSKVMGRREISLDQKQERMRERHSSVAHALPTVAPFTERHYSVPEVAAMWNLSPDAIRRIFQGEPGVLVLGGSESTRKRRYTTLRIPESVLVRVHRKLAVVR